MAETDDVPQAHVVAVQAHPIKDLLLYRAHKMLVALSLTPVDPTLAPLLRQLIVDMNEALK